MFTRRDGSNIFTQQQQQQPTPLDKQHHLVGIVDTLEITPVNQLKLGQVCSPVLNFKS